MKYGIEFITRRYTFRLILIINAKCPFVFKKDLKQNS